ncbi:hypothetical protein PP175_22165 [Aneurinibacillus sp. Ricciae_BoGa-3]|uniref:hypothetical protein n=1 Tax=Aneurinibacillus sp. Ricciae_BoGa-3 TaxID=3022697 RepID=UPI0023407ED0|nr:hypothetical protein [Aneurinibacillus sp. Ricciae_BoGa-3]WCK53996.1 hypothetical protein PP175_22165 [Aneurinibacillus sp. Ricciae_BoGa-3]
MADTDKNLDEQKNSEDRQWDPLNTPQIANSKRAQRRLGRGAPMPGVYIGNDNHEGDDEEDATIDERLSSIQKNMQQIRQGMSEEAEKAKDILEEFQTAVKRDNGENTE